MNPHPGPAPQAATQIGIGAEYLVLIKNRIRHFFCQLKAEIVVAAVLKGKACHGF